MKKKTFRIFAEADLGKIFKSEERILMRKIKNEFTKKPLKINKKELIVIFHQHCTTLSPALYQPHYNS